MNPQSELSSIVIIMFHHTTTAWVPPLTFSNQHKHVNAISFDGKDYVMIEFDMTGIWTRVIKCHSLGRLASNLRQLKSISSIFVVQINNTV